MGYLIKAILGLGLFVGGIVLFNVKLVSLLETGTCASGNVPYEIAPGYQCPDDTGRDVLLLTASIFGGLIGAAIFAFRGDPPWAAKDKPLGGGFSFGAFAWGLFFTATGATSLIASLSNEAIKQSNGGQLGGIIVGATFLLMGVPALLFAFWNLINDYRSRDETPATIGGVPQPAPMGGVMGRMAAGLNQAEAAQKLYSRLPWGAAGGQAAAGSAGGQIAKLERLQRLRESGALTDTEFEREKARILGGG
jgi:Short C-terminal domain